MAVGTCTCRGATMASAEEVQALKREVEMLKQLLEQERRSGGSLGDLSARSSVSLSSSPGRSQQQQQQRSPDVYFSGSKSFEEDFRRETTPRRPTTAAASPTRSKNLRWKDLHTPQQQQTPFQSTNYSQFVPIDTKRGKWWLKDRQILSRNSPGPNDQTIAMKVRETWLWSGRTVVIDKIVTCPRPRDDDLDHDHDHDHDHSERDGDRRVRDLQDEAARYRDELRQIGVNRKPSTPSPVSPTMSATSVAAQSAFHDSKQLAKEFVQPMGNGNAVVDALSADSSGGLTARTVDAETLPLQAQTSQTKSTTSDSGTLPPL